MPQLDEAIGLVIGDDASLSGKLGGFTHVRALQAQHSLCHLVLVPRGPMVAILKILRQDPHLPAVVVLKTPAGDPYEDTLRPEAHYYAVGPGEAARFGIK
ncbi:hypothetical protein ABZ479_03625 [Streptomyces sp. NPDC005722]